MRGTGIVGALIVIWLIFGVLAAGQRGYLSGEREVSCRTFGDTALTVVAGPLNYFGVNPKVHCDTRPSR